MWQFRIQHSLSSSTVLGSAMRSFTCNRMSVLICDAYLSADLVGFENQAARLSNRSNPPRRCRHNHCYSQGIHLSNRPGMARLLEMLDAGAVNTVIIAKLDRLTRSVNVGKNCRSGVAA